ncbi:hypothetical protein ACFLUR_02800, partial [Chloroflexota bacterium]
TDVLRTLKKYNHTELITSAVSCSHTRLTKYQTTHCGGCFQCIDRRLAGYASDLYDIDDSGIYNHDLIEEPICTEEKTTLIDYIRQAKHYFESTIESFTYDYLNEIDNVAEPISQLYPEIDEQSAVNKVWELFNRHGKQIDKALRTIENKHSRPFNKTLDNTLLSIIYEKPYLKDPVTHFVASICEQLSTFIPLSFPKNNLPTDERDFNNKISALLASKKEEYEREHPAIRFALADSVPDHTFLEYQLLIESKYIRGNTSPSKVSSGIAEDLTKYSGNGHILFVVFDPDRNIPDVSRFCKDFENKGNCSVKVFR